MPVSRTRKVRNRPINRREQKAQRRRRIYAATVHAAWTLAIRGKLKKVDFLRIRAVAFGTLNRVAARLRSAMTPQPGSGAEA